MRVIDALLPPAENGRALFALAKSETAVYFLSAGHHGQPSAGKARPTQRRGPDGMFVVEGFSTAPAEGGTA